MQLIKHIGNRLLQFNIEVKNLITGLELLIINLAFIDKIKLAGYRPNLVIVDSWRYMLILRFLWMIGLLSFQKILVVRKIADPESISLIDFSESSILIISSRTFIKYYQSLITLRHQGKLIVI